MTGSVNRLINRSILLWSTLGLWILAELLFSSHWWPPGSNPLTEPQLRQPTNGMNVQNLKQLLAELPGVRVWMAPYFTYPEPGVLESRARLGVYDNFLVVPRSGSVTMNYGAYKLSPADTLFSLASVQGLGAEWSLAHHLGYNRFALDLGAVTQPVAATQLCLSTPQCRISGDGYAVFVIPRANATGYFMVQRLNGLIRNIPQLPFKSAGPSWGPLVFNPFQWRAIETTSTERDGYGLRLLVQSLPGRSWQIYRYPLSRYPTHLHKLLALRHDDIQLVLPPGVSGLEVCLGVVGQACESIKLTSTQSWQSIGSLLKPAQLTRINLVSSHGRAPFISTILLKLSIPMPANELLRNGHGLGVAK